MTTETPPTPDPQLTIWAERLESDLAEAGMETPEARAFGRAFELGLAHALSQFATRQDLRQAIDDLRREIDQRFAKVDQRLDEQRRYFDERLKDLRTWVIVSGGLLFSMLTAILVKVFS